MIKNTLSSLIKIYSPYTKSSFKSIYFFFFIKILYFVSNNRRAFTETSQTNRRLSFLCATNFNDRIARIYGVERNTDETEPAIFIIEELRLHVYGESAPMNAMENAATSIQEDLLRRLRLSRDTINIERRLEIIWTPRRCQRFSHSVCVAFRFRSFSTSLDAAFYTAFSDVPESTELWTRKHRSLVKRPVDLYQRKCRSNYLKNLTILFKLDN